MRCAFCLTEMRLVGPDTLDQSGDTYLPAERFECPKCSESGLQTCTVMPTGEPYRSPPETIPCAPRS